MPRLEVEGYGAYEVPEGKRLVLALEDAGVDVLHRCGGKAKCTTCRVEFTAGEPDTMTQAEWDVLQAKGVAGQGRLSCQILCQHDMALKPLRTVANSGLDAGPRPADAVEPEPVRIPRVTL
ncbi:MAG TPA: 2Fe-2S iron-sulfur cluster-binding protein [Deinococcales bacterium]|nr:2Fe-2S iron-sulfur cluster-binding protein [Deinococcales bacterium]